MAGRRTVIKPQAIAAAIALWAKYPHDPEKRNREFAEKHTYTKSTRKKIFRESKPAEPAAAALPTPPSVAPPRESMSPEDELKLARQSAIDFYTNERNNGQHAKDRIQSQKSLDKLYANYPGALDKDLTPEEQCKKLQQDMDQIFGIGFTVTLAKPKRKAKKKKKK